MDYSNQLGYDPAHAQACWYPPADWAYRSSASPPSDHFDYAVYSPGSEASVLPSLYTSSGSIHPPSTELASVSEEPPSPLDSRTTSSSSDLGVGPILHYAPPSLPLSPLNPILPPADYTTAPQSSQLPFIAKLRNLLAHEDRNCDVLRWDESGTAFLVAHTNPRFKNEVLSTTYGHNNYASFTRQLNIYGFNRLSTDALAALLAPAVSLKSYHGWKHPLFTRANVGNLAGTMRPRPSQARRREKEEKLRKGAKKV